MAATVYYTTAEVAALLNVKPETVRRWLRDGTVRGVKIGRVHRIDSSDLDRAFGTDHVARELALQVEHELHLHTPVRGVCQACGGAWPCDPILNAAIALDVKLTA